MKKLLTIAVLVAVTVASCSKKANTVSVAYTPSFPVVKITSDTFFTILLEGMLPNTVTATAYDTFYKKSLDSVVVVDYSAVDVTTPGLYLVTASAKNQNGYVGYAYAYVNVVSSITALVNFTGRYMQQTNGDTVFVTSKLDHNGNVIPGFYTTNNVAGVHSSTDSIGYITPAFFAQNSNSQITVPTQYTPLGFMSFANASCIVASADTAFQYQVLNKNFGPSQRVFKRF